MREDAVKLTEQEKKLIELIRTIKFGELHIYVAEGKPIRAEQILKSIKF